MDNIQPIPQFPNYTISSDGVIHHIKFARLKRLYPNEKGYLMVSLQQNHRRKHYRLHRLLAEVFIPNPLNLPEVNHKDGNKLNNHLSNLEWVTSLENITHGRYLGLINNVGSNNGNAILTEEQVRQIKQHKGTVTAQAMADKYKVSRSTVRSIYKKQRWSHVV